MQLRDNGMFLDPIKKDLEHVLLKVCLGQISDIRPVTEGYGKEISKYAMKFGLDIDDDRLKEIIIDMKGKRMVSKFGNCYGKGSDDDIEELTQEEEKEYVTLKKSGSHLKYKVFCFLFYLSFFSTYYLYMIC